MENLIKPLQQWANEDYNNRGVLVLATNGEKSCSCLTGTTHTVAKAVATQLNEDPLLRKILLMGLLAASENNRFLSLRARLIVWLLK